MRVGNSGFVLYALLEPSFLIHKVLKRVYRVEVCCFEGTGGSLAGERWRQAGQEEKLSVWQYGGSAWGRVGCKRVSKDGLGVAGLGLYMCLCC